MNQNPTLPNDEESLVRPDASQALNTLSAERVNTNFNDHSTVYTQDVEEDSFDWQRLLSIIRRRKKIIAFTLLSVMALAGLYLAVTPKIYQASADLLINSQQKSSGGPLGGLPAIQDMLDATGTRSMDTEVGIILSSMVQEAAVEVMPNAMRPALERKNAVSIDVQSQRSTDIIRVSVKSPDPKLAIAYSNAVCEAYRLQNQKNNSAQYKETAEYVGDQLEKVRENLNKKRAELKQFKEANGVVNLTAESESRVVRLNDLQASLQQVEADRIAGEAQLRDLRAQVASMPAAEIAPSTIVVSPIVQQLRRQLTDLEAEREAALQEYVPGASEIKAFDVRIEELRNRLKTEAKTEVGTSTRNINPVRQAALADISKIQASIESAQARASELKGNIEKARQRVEKLPLREYQLSQLEGDLTTYLQTFQSLSDKYQTLLISQQTPVDNARVITPATKAPKVSPRVAPVLLLALISGLLLSTGLAVLVDRIDDKIYSEEDAVQATGLPVLTHVPKLDHKANTSLLIGQEETSVMLLESFRMLRTQLSFISSYGHLKALVLTSSQPSEGKSTVSSNLAIALALNKKKVILVDTDLRRPTIHKVFDINNSKGFTSIVAGTETLEEAIQPSEIEDLSILTSGPKPPNPAELLDSRMARDLIDQLKTQFDYVIIDAPPALFMADAQIVASMSDGVLMVVSCQEAKRGAVERTYELMSQTGVKVVGMVLNKFTEEQNGYYGYKYGDYSSYLDAPEEENLSLEADTTTRIK